MNKLSPEEENDILIFIKDWLKVHGYTQKDLANELNIKSSRTSEILIKIREFHKKGGIFNIAKNLIKIEQNWLKNNQSKSQTRKTMQPYNQLDIDSLVTQIQNDIMN